MQRVITNVTDVCIIKLDEYLKAFHRFQVYKQPVFLFIWHQPFGFVQVEWRIHKVWIRNGDWSV